MKIKAKVLQTQITPDGRMLAKIQCNKKLPPVNALIDISYGSLRSGQQNALLWTYYTFLVEDCGLKEQGFFTPECIHVALKAHFLSEKIMNKGQFVAIEEGTTTTLTKSEFTDYFEKVDLFVKDFFEIDTEPFWKTHRENYSLE